MVAVVEVLDETLEAAVLGAFASAAPGEFKCTTSPCTVMVPLAAFR